MFHIEKQGVRFAQTMVFFTREPLFKGAMFHLQETVVSQILKGSLRMVKLCYTKHISRFELNYVKTQEASPSSISFIC